MIRRLRRLARAVRLRLQGRIDCAPRLDRWAPYPDYDTGGGFWIVVEPMSKHVERCWWGPSLIAHCYLRRTAAGWNAEYSAQTRAEQRDTPRPETAR